MANRVTIGVDLGGTHIKLGIFDETGTFRNRRRIDTDADRPAEAIADTILHAVQDCETLVRRDGQSVAAAGLVMPGLLEDDGTTIRFVANIPALNGFPLPLYLSDRLAYPIVLDADSNGAAWGEYCRGAGAGCRRLVVMTVGTGIGVGVVIDGALVRTTHGTAGSLGHILVDATGPTCACGARGCLERMAGLSGINEDARREAAAHPESKLAALLHERGSIGGAELAGALDAGDAAAMAVVHRCGRWLGIGAVSMAVMFAPERIVIGGGLSRLGRALLDPIAATIREVGGPPFVEGVEVVPSALGADAGVIGAAALAREGVQ